MSRGRVVLHIQPTLPMIGVATALTSLLLLPIVIMDGP